MSEEIKVICEPQKETNPEMCKFHKKSCFAVCNGKGWENCWMYKTNESVVKAQEINIQQNI